MNIDKLYEKFIDDIVAVEKGYVDHKNDRGGKTNWGITEKVARANGYTGDMKDMPVDFAKTVYFKRYISEPGFDKVAQVSEKVAAELIDTGVNMGPARAAEFLQRALNIFNQQGSRYEDLFVDGRIGGITLEALKSFIEWRGVRGVNVMVCVLNCLQGARYIEIAENDPTQEAFTFGWFDSRVFMGNSK